MTKIVSYISVLTIVATTNIIATQAQQPDKAPAPNKKGLVITNNNGGIFMEEVKTDKDNGIGKLSDPNTKMKRPIDVRELGVPLDEEGKIIPLIDLQKHGYMPSGTSIDAYRQYYWPQIPSSWTNVPVNKINPVNRYYPNYMPNGYWPYSSFPYGPNGSLPPLYLY